MRLATCYDEEVKARSHWRKKRSLGNVLNVRFFFFLLLMISFSLLLFFLITQEEESVAQKAVGSVGSGLAVRGSGALQSRRIGFQLN